MKQTSITGQVQTVNRISIFKLLSFLIFIQCIYALLLPPAPLYAAKECGVARDIAKLAATSFAKNKKKGLKLFIKAQTLCPNDPQIAYNLGIAYYTYGQPDQSIKQLKNALKKQPDNAKWHNNLAAIYLSRPGGAAAALSHAQKAVKLNPQIKDAHITLAETELAAGKYHDSLQHIATATKKWPQDNSVKQLHEKVLNRYLSHYLDLIQAGKTEEGLAGLAAIKTEPEAVRVHALTLSGLKRYDQALQIARQGKRSFTNSKEWDTLFDEILDGRIRDLFVSYKSGKQAEATQEAKNLYERFPGRANAKEAYDKLFNAFIADTSDIEVPDVIQTSRVQADKNKGGYKTRLAQLTGSADNATAIENESLLVDVDTTIPKGVVDNPYGIAIIIGNQRYSKMNKGISDVSYAERDAMVMKKYLKKVMGFREENIIYRLNTSSGDLRNIFGSKENPHGMLHNYIRPGESEVFIYYSGHGAPGPKGNRSYLVPVDARADYIANNGYDLGLFYNVLEKLPATKVTVVLDACFSGDSESGQLFTNISPAMLQSSRPVRKLKNSIIFASADQGQVSTWYPAKRHSTFSYFFFKGIGGAADSNSDRQITVAEMENYLGKEVKYYAQRISNRKQTPLVVGDSGQVLVRLR